MNEEEAIKAQKEWLAQLLELRKGKPIYGQYLEGRPDDFKKVWVELNRHDIVLTRQILNNEVVFDFDYKSWKDVKNQSKLLVKYLVEQGIPHIIASSGGKGIHVHIFLNPRTLAFGGNEDDKVFIDEEIARKAVEVGVDIPRAIRKAVFCYIARTVGLKISTPQDRQGLDTSKVFFSTNGSKGSLIRDFGCPRKDGNVKSVIKDIPNTKPKTTGENVVFPGEIVIAQMKRFKVPVEQELIEETENFVRMNSEEPLELNGKAMDIPCYRNLINGVSPGARNIAVFSIGRIGCLMGNDLQETLKDIKTFCKKSDYKESEAEQSIRSAYKRKDQRTFCGSMIYNFGHDVCDKENCPIEKGKTKIAL